MALTTITNSMVSVNAIQGTLIADNAITAVHIATNAVSGTLVADNAITAVHIAQNVITVTQLADDAVEADKIADGVITTNHLNSAMISSQSAVTANTSDYVLIGDASDSNALKKALVSDFGATANIGADAITGAKIADDAIDSEHYTDGSIDTAHIGDNQVTLAKMAGITRGSILIGNSSGDPAALAIGSNDYVLTSDGTDIAWEAASAGATLSGSTNNTVVTVTGSNAMQGEANMTFDGTDLSIPAKLIHLNDTDTYIDFPDPNSIRFNTGGKNTMNMYEGVCFMNSVSPTAPSGSAERSYIYHDNASNTQLRIGNQYGNDAAAIRFETRNTERMTILGSGKIGIGETGPDSLLHIKGGAPVFTIESNTNSTSRTWQIATERVAGGDLAFQYGTTLGGTPNTTALYLANDGDVRCGTTGVVYGSLEEMSLFYVDFGFGMRGTGTALGLWHSSNSGTYVAFAYGGGGAAAGSITFSTTTVTYGSASDYRLKENIDYDWDATTRLKQLKPARFNWIEDDTNTLQDGFLAHEVQSVVPEAIIGTKDQVYTAEEAANAPNTSEGDIKIQEMDSAKLVPLLVKTIQELEARITTLEG